MHQKHSQVWKVLEVWTLNVRGLQVQPLDQPLLHLLGSCWQRGFSAPPAPASAQPVRTSVGGLSPHGMLMTAELQRGCRAPGCPSRSESRHPAYGVRSRTTSNEDGVTVNEELGAGGGDPTPLHKRRSRSWEDVEQTPSWRVREMAPKTRVPSETWQVAEDVGIPGTDGRRQSKLSPGSKGLIKTVHLGVLDRGLRCPPAPPRCSASPSAPRGACARGFPPRSPRCTSTSPGGTGLRLPLAWRVSCTN